MYHNQGMRKPWGFPGLFWQRGMLPRLGKGTVHAGTEEMLASHSITKECNGLLFIFREWIQDKRSKFNF